MERKNIFPPAALFFLMLVAACVFTACQEEAIEGDPDVPIPSDISPPALQTAYAEDEQLLREVDSLTRRLYIAYNTRVLYKWDRQAVGSISSYPPELHKVPAYLKFMEQIFFTYMKNMEALPDGTIDETRGLVFLKRNLPATFLLLGESIQAEDSGNGGISAAGLAESNLKIFLTGVNRIALDDPGWVSEQYRTFHHEFAHILDRRYERPKGFDSVSAGKYVRTSGWQQLSQLEALRRGFTRNYGASNEAEDFATIAEEMATTSRGSVAGKLELSQLLKAKYEMVVDFYRTLGVDVQGMGNNFALSENASGRHSK